MQDTIDLLEAIGSDASLRHASADDLTRVLEEAKASEALTAAVASGDSTALFDQLGQKPMYAPQVSQIPGHDDQEPSRDDTEESGDPAPTEPTQPPAQKQAI